MNSKILNNTPKVIDGVRLAAGDAGVKNNGRADFVLVELCEGAKVAGVFTQNAFAAAPVSICRAHLSKSASRYLAINSGNANACTGAKGHADALAVCTEVAELNGLDTESVLPFSTGVIGENLPIESMKKAIPSIAQNLDAANWQVAAEAIMTTDTVPKIASRVFKWQDEIIAITGIAKGAGMIKPNMATMLAYVATNAGLSQEVVEQCAKIAANKSFNRISIDGDTSTNDAAVLIATGATQAGEITDLDSDFGQVFLENVVEVYEQLAKAIVLDGEGATKFVEVVVDGGRSSQESLEVAYSIAHSPLVKTALFASDPNWGRIVMAIGKVDLEGFDASRVDVWLDDVKIVEQGGRAPEYTEAAGQAVFSKPAFEIRVCLNRGDRTEKIWTSDLSHEYVRINAEYRS